jgi:hypothetical protein
MFCHNLARRIVHIDKCRKEIYMDNQSKEIPAESHVPKIEDNAVKQDTVVARAQPDVITNQATVQIPEIPTPIIPTPTESVLVSTTKDIPISTSLSEKQEYTPNPEILEKQHLRREYAFAAISSILSEDRRGPSSDGMLRQLSQKLSREYNDMTPENVKDLESFESLGTRLQAELLVLQQSVLEDAKLDAQNALRSTLKELNWRNGFSEVLPNLSKQEQDALLDLTRNDVSKGFSALFDGDTDVTDTLSKAKEAWNVHKNLFSTNKDLELKDRYKWMPEPMRSFMVRGDKVGAIEGEMTAITMQSIGDILKMHPDWVKDGTELFVKYLLPLLKG